MSDPEAERREAGVVCGVADALQAGDEVYVGHRSQAIEVLGRSEDRGHGVVRTSDYPYRVVHLRGNGTEYRLRYSHRGDTFPHLHTESDLEAYETYCHRHNQQCQRVRSTGTGETVARLRPVGVEPTDVVDWALARNIDGDTTEDTTRDAQTNDQ